MTAAPRRAQHRGDQLRPGGADHALRARTRGDGARLERIVIVDNGSTDDSVERLRGTFPSCPFVALEENIGYARAANAGADALEGEHYLIMNNDAFVQIRAASPRSWTHSRRTRAWHRRAARPQRRPDPPADGEAARHACRRARARLGAAPVRPEPLAAAVEHPLGSRRVARDRRGRRTGGPQCVERLERPRRLQPADPDVRGGHGHVLARPEARLGRLVRPSRPSSSTSVAPRATGNGRSRPGPSGSAAPRRRSCTNSSGPLAARAGHPFIGRRARSALGGDDRLRRERRERRGPAGGDRRVRRPGSARGDVDGGSRVA